MDLILDLLIRLEPDQLFPLVTLFLGPRPLFFCPLASVLSLERRSVLLNNVDESVDVIVTKTGLVGQMADATDEVTMEFCKELGLVRDGIHGSAAK